MVLPESGKYYFIMAENIDVDGDSYYGCKREGIVPFPTLSSDNIVTMISITKIVILD